VRIGVKGRIRFPASIVNYSDFRTSMISCLFIYLFISFSIKNLTGEYDNIYFTRQKSSNGLKSWSQKIIQIALSTLYPLSYLISFLLPIDIYMVIYNLYILWIIVKRYINNYYSTNSTPKSEHLKVLGEWATEVSKLVRIQDGNNVYMKYTYYNLNGV
jgi:hypothetical protein